MTGGTLNLSLLSRGVGEVHSNGHERVDVFLEPEDYYNFTTHPERVYLPPLQSSFDHDVDGSQHTSRSQKDSYRVPKTFTTRKGALLLFSEDLAQRNTEPGGKGKDHFNTHYDVSSNRETQQPLRTVEDLTKSILKYGAQDAINNKVYLKFVRTHRDNFERQIRPGFSAKRYLATWTRTWDDSVFENVLKHGYMTERSLYKANKAAPNLKRRLLYEDLSHMPQPYKLMKNMLLTPSSLSGYTFYRVPTDLISVDEQAELEEEEVLSSNMRPSSVSSIRVIRTVDTSQEVVDYNDLDKESQTNVITDLLVKSAVHYALKKQEELYEKSLMRAMNGEGLQGVHHVETFEFDMKEAVESLLDSHNGKYSLRSSIPDIDDRNNNFDMAAFRKAESSDARALKMRAFTSGRMSGSDATDTDIPSVSSRSGSTSSEFSGIPVLPPIRHTLSPIKDVSRETSQMVVLPSINRGSASLDLPTVNIQPATPQHSTLTALSSTSVDMAQDKSFEIIDPGSSRLDAVKKSNKKGHKKDAVFDTLNSGIMFQPPPLPKPTYYHQEAMHLENFHFGHHSGHSSITSPVDSLDVSNRRHWLMMAGGQADSMKGSVIMAPDGEIVSVGGSVIRGGVHRSDVGNMNDVLPIYRNEGADESGLSEDEPEPWNMDKKLSLPLSVQSKSSYQRGSIASSSVSREDLSRLSSTGKYLLWDQTSKISADSSPRVSGVSEKDIMDTLADHAHHIAENVLSHSGAGSDLEMDVKQAADLWTQTHPKRTILRTLSGASEAVDEIMKSSSPSSIASSAADYKSLIAKSLTAAGLDPAQLTSDPEISPDVIEALSSHSLTPEQIELVSDGESKMKIKVKVDLDQAMGGVQHGHLHVAHGLDTEDGPGKRHISIPAESANHLEDSNMDVISYQTPDAGVESRAGTSKSVSQPKEKPQEAMAEVFNDKDDREIEKSAEEDVVTLEESSSGKKLGMLDKSGQTLTPILKTPERKDVDTVKEVKEVRLITPQKSDTTTDGKVKKEKKLPDQKEEPFVVGGVDRRNELTMLYGGEMPTPGGPPPRVVPPKKAKGKPREKKQKKEPALKKETAAKKEEKKTKKGKKGKKGKKKEEESSPPEQPLPTEAAPEVIEEKQPTPPPPPIPDEREETPIPSSPEAVSEEEDFEFNFIREATSPPPPEAPLTSKSDKEVVSDQDEVGESDEEDATTVSNLKSISNQEARAAKRAAAAAKRREEVERRRREKDEQQRREKEEKERLQGLQKEMEEDKRRRDEEKRLRKLQEQEAEEKEKREQEEAERRKKLEAERERRAKEEYQRKLDELRRKQLEDEMKRHELLLEQQKEEERLRLEEELMMSKMAEEERLEYERRKKMIEEERKKREEEERLQREEETRKTLEELQRKEAELARERAKIEAHLRFNRSLREETDNLTQAHQVNRAFVFSYFELLQWLGLDVPDFELTKMANY